MDCTPIVSTRLLSPIADDYISTWCILDREYDARFLIWMNEIFKGRSLEQNEIILMISILRTNKYLPVAVIPSCMNIATL